MELILVRPRREGEVHKMGNRSLTLSTVRILHTELLSLCILIQRPKLLPLLVLRLAALLVPGSRARSRGCTAASTPALPSFVGEDLRLCTSGTALAGRRGRFGCRGYRLGGDGRHLT